MRYIVAAVGLLLAGCDSSGVDRVVLDVAGQVVVAETGAPVEGASVYLQAAYLSEPDIVSIIERAESDADGRYALSFDVPVVREALAGGCIARVGDRAEEARLVLAVSATVDDEPLYATTVPACESGMQVRDLRLRPLF